MAMMPGPVLMSLWKWLHYLFIHCICLKLSDFVPIVSLATMLYQKQKGSEQTWLHLDSILG